MSEIEPGHTPKPLAPPSPAWHRNWMIVGIIMLGCFWWVRYDLGVDWSFWSGALIGAAIGALFYGWLKDVY